MSARRKRQTIADTSPPAKRIRALETERAYLRAELAAALAILEVLVDSAEVGTDELADDRRPSEEAERREAITAARALLERYTP